MKIYLSIVAILFVFAFQTNARVADLKTTVEVKESFIKSFNEGDYKAIYALAGAGFHREVPEEAFVGFKLVWDGKSKLHFRVSAASVIAAEPADFASFSRFIPN